MIILQNVSKGIVTKYKQERQVLTSVNLQIPSNQRIALFSSAPENTPVLINLLAGLFPPTSGRIVRHASVSFPVGHPGGFDLQLSIRHNVAYVARLYGAEVDAVVEFVRCVSGLRDAYEKPFGQLLPADIRRIALIIAYSIPFDLYLHASDLTNPMFRKRLGANVLALIEERLSSSGAIIPSRNLRTATEICEMALILHKGSLYLVDDIWQIELALNELSATPYRRPSSNVARLGKLFGKGF